MDIRSVAVNCVDVEEVEHAAAVLRNGNLRVQIEASRVLVPLGPYAEKGLEQIRKMLPDHTVEVVDAPVDWEQVHAR